MERNLRPKELLIAPIIQELMAINPEELNVVMAEEATKRLGRPVDRREISTVRCLLKLGMHHQVAREQARVITEALRKSLL